MSPRPCLALTAPMLLLWYGRCPLLFELEELVWRDGCWSLQWDWFRRWESQLVMEPTASHISPIRKRRRENNGTDTGKTKLQQHLQQPRSFPPKLTFDFSTVHRRRQVVRPRPDGQGPRQPGQPPREGPQAGRHPRRADAERRRQGRHRRRAGQAGRRRHPDRQELPRHPRREQPPGSPRRRREQVWRDCRRRPRRGRAQGHLCSGEISFPPCYPHSSGN